MAGSQQQQGDQRQWDARKMETTVAEGKATVGTAAAAETVSTAGAPGTERQQSEKQQQQSRQQHKRQLEHQGIPITAGKPESVEHVELTIAFLSAVRADHLFCDTVSLTRDLSFFSFYR
jgi:hypothetical protein